MRFSRIFFLRSMCILREGRISHAFLKVELPPFDNMTTGVRHYELPGMPRMEDAEFYGSFSLAHIHFGKAIRLGYSPEKRLGYSNVPLEELMFVLRWLCDSLPRTLANPGIGAATAAASFTNRRRVPSKGFPIHLPNSIA